jgi:putative endonuclease
MSASETHRSYWVYILASKPHGTLYIGATNSLQRRVWQHKNGAVAGFTKQYRIDRLVYFEEFRDISNAIARETQLKDWLRAKKIALIENENPLWRDLAAEWHDEAISLGGFIK